MPSANLPSRNPPSSPRCCTAADPPRRRIRRPGVVVSGSTRLLGLGITFWSAQRCLDRQLGIGEMLLLGTVAAGVAGSILALSLAAIGYRALRPQFERMN